MNKLTTSLLALTFIFGASILVACKPADKLMPLEVIRPVKTITVGVSPPSAGASFSAEIRPRVESQLAFRVGGKVVERLVEIGQTVRKDQLLMRLDPADLQLSANAALAQVAVAKANDDVAQAALKRAQDLARQNFISQGALDQALGTAASARAALKAAEANSLLGVNAALYGGLKADSDGVVTALTAEVGQVIAAGSPVLRMAAGRDKDVVFNVPEALVSSVKRGATVSVQLWSQPGVSLTATVRDVAAIADPLTRTFAVKANIKDPNGQAVLGATATASLAMTASKASSALSIPMAAVVEWQGQTAVWVVANGVVKKQAVGLEGASGADGQIAVASGLAQGAVIVIAGTHVLRDGQKVKLDTTKP